MNVIDKILNEWSFRCHDGIVDINNSTKLSILKEILVEEGIDDDIVDAVLNLPKDDQASEEKKQKALAVLTTGTTSETGISDAVAALNDEEKQKVLKYINNKFKEELKDYLELDKKVKDRVGNFKTADIISAFAVKTKEDDELLEYLSNPDKQLSFNFELTTGDLLTTLEGIKLFTKNFLTKIIEFTPSEKGKALGVGEIALELFFKNAKKENIGDVRIDGKLIELKSQSARFSGEGEGRSGNITSLYSAFETKYPEIKLKAKESSLGLYIDNIINSLPEDKLENELEYINNEINQIYPNTENIKIEKSDTGNINKKLIKKYIASYVALYKDNDYYMLISNQSPFKYNLYTPEELINNSDNLSFTNNITPSTSYPNLNLGQPPLPSDEENFKPKKLKEPETINISKEDIRVVPNTQTGQQEIYVNEDWFNKSGNEKYKEFFDSKPIQFSTGIKYFKLNPSKSKKFPISNDLLKENLTEELTNYLIKSFK